MECLLEAHPYPDITWFQSEKSIADSPRVRMLRKTTSKDSYLLTLEISNPTREDGGHYRCNAFNEYGESNANIALNFQGMLLRKPYHPTYIFVLCVCETSQFRNCTVLISVSICSSAVFCPPTNYRLVDLCLLSFCMSMAFDSITNVCTFL